MASIKEQFAELRALKPKTSIINKDEKAPSSDTQIFEEITDQSHLQELRSIFMDNESVKNQKGRPKNPSYLGSRKFTVRLKFKLDEYFKKLKDLRGQEIGKDSKKLNYLIREHQIWERVLKNYCANMRRYISLIEREIVSLEISKSTEGKMNDIYLLYGLYQISLDDHARYFTEKELKIIRLCITYVNNRKN